MTLKSLLADWSIVDIYWNVITSEEREKIISWIDLLPVTKFKDDILNVVTNSPVTIIQWETWSWKTTQIPKMLEKFWSVITTQPRVISAISLSDRVSREIMAQTWDNSYSLGLKVWYRTGQQVSSTHTSKLSFHTDWLELMRQWLSWIYPDVLVLDEIHGYSIPTEMIASNIRNHMLKTKSDMKLVLMSATVNPSILQKYFKDISRHIPVIKIPGRNHKVEKHFLLTDNYINPVCDLYKSGKNILVFAEWKKEIEWIISSLKSYLWEKTPIFPLHSELPINDQVRLLKKENPEPIIVVATNIAEESITIDYIDAVVDLWKEKTIFVNSYWIDELRTIDISKANSMQRAWRWWRTHEWIYVRANSTDYESLRDYAIAPIEKEMIDRFILIWLLDSIDIKKDFEDLYIHTPSEELLNLSYTRLKTLWAINKKWEITDYWINLLKLPLSIYNSAILWESIEKWCSETVVTMVAILEKKWFLSKTWEWKGIKMLGKTEWDLFSYLDLFRLITSNQISNWKLDLLIELWVDETEVELFKKLNWQKMLFEVVNLDLIWIKTKKVFEIYNMIKLLKEKVEQLWYKLWKKTDINDIKHSLVAWHLHNIYRYNWDTKKFISYNNDNPIEFKAWDVSLIEAENWGIYIWSPFIIWWASDLDILTNIVKIDEWAIKEYYDKLIGEDLWEIFGHENPKTKRNIAEADLWQFIVDEISFDLPIELQLLKDKTKSRHYLAKNWLPYYLVNHNKNFINFIKQSKLDKSIFAELLKKVVLSEMHRINPDNLEKTILIFENDKVIFNLFIDSDDQVIKAFIAWKIKTLEDFAKFEIK